MAEHRSSADAQAEESTDPGYSALPPEGATCICGEAAHALVTIQTGVQTCDSCGSQVANTEQIHLCDLHNDLRMQGKLDGAKLLLAHRLHSSGGLKGLSTAERDSTLDLVLGIADPESVQRVWASDETGVRLLERTEQEKLTNQLQRQLRKEAKEASN
jgi:hypothetical protein